MACGLDFEPSVQIKLNVEPTFVDSWSMDGCSTPPFCHRMYELGNVPANAPEICNYLHN
jgi:hypothetical protein